MPDSCVGYGSDSSSVGEESGLGPTGRETYSRGLAGTGGLPEIPALGGSRGGGRGPAGILMSGARLGLEWCVSMSWLMA